MTPVCSLRLVDFMWQFLRLGRLAVLVCYWLVFYSACVGPGAVAGWDCQLRKESSISMAHILPMIILFQFRAELLKFFAGPGLAQFWAKRFLPGLEPGLNWTYLPQAFFAGFAGLISSPKLGKLNLKCEKGGLGRVRKVNRGWRICVT